MNTNLDLLEIVEEAFERATGGARPMRSGYDFKTARRSINIMMMEWANRGVNLWTIDQGTIALQKGVAQYVLPIDTVDLIEHAVRQNSQSELQLTRISVSTYATIPNKAAVGRPTQLFIQRLVDAPKINLWPVPDNDSYTMTYWRLRRISDAGNSGAAKPDVPFRFTPALLAGLAFHLAQKLPEGADRAEALKQEYEEAFELAATEDRDRASARFVPLILR